MKESILKNLPFDSIIMSDRIRETYEVEDLQNDIKEHGLIQTIAVEDNEDGTFRLLAGGRRMTACKNLKYETMPCKVFPPLDEYERKCVELAENIHREDLTYPEKVALTKEIHVLWVSRYGEKKGAGTTGHSQADTARALGVSSMQISREIELADAIEILPELGKCKNQAQALKLLGRFKEKLIKEELAKRANEVISKEGEGAAKRVLISNYIVGDFFDNKIENRSVHCVEIDPPYSIRLESTKKDDSGGTIGYNDILDSDYPDFLDKIIKESHRILFDNGWLILWFAMKPWYATVEALLLENGFTLPIPAIWIKDAKHAQTHWPDRYLGSSYEPFFYARKGNATIFKQGRSNIFDYIPVPSDNKIHPTERPIELMMELLTCFCPPSGRIAVPCCGSGTTILAANNLGMHAVGWDTSKDYKSSYTVRVMSGKIREFKI